MPVLAQVILLTCITGIGSGVLGAGIATFINVESNRVASIMLSFAAGLMLAIIFFDFVPEATELGEGAGHLTLVMLCIALGAAFIGILVHVIDKKAGKHMHCCSCVEDRESCATKSEHTGHKSPESLKVAGLVLAAAIAMHNIPAGMSIGASFAASSGALMGDGITIAILMGLHSIPESMSLGVPFLHAGYTRAKTVGIAAIVGATTVAGSIVGFIVGGIGLFWLGMSLAFASGAMLYVLFGEILPEAFSLFDSKKPAVAVIVGILCGLLLVHL